MGHCASAPGLVWTSSRGCSWAVMDQGTHQERSPPARVSPTALRAREHSQVSITSQCNQGALDQCGSQQSSGPSSSKLLGAALLWLCSARLAESREDPSATGPLPFLQLSSAGQVSLLSAFPSAGSVGQGDGLSGCPPLSCSPYKGDEIVLVFKAV